MNKRLFIGIPVKPEEVRIPVSSFKNEIGLNENKISWVKPEKWHITIQFLGDTDEDRIPDIQRSISESFFDAQKTLCEVKNIGVFPNFKHPKVLWAGLENTKDIALRKKRLNKLLRYMNFDVDMKPFNPHLTLGRIRRINNKPAISELVGKYKNIKFSEIKINKVILYESILTQSGPVYKELFEFNF